MGCSTSKLDDEEAVQLCRDRKRFIKQAVEQRARFAYGHFAYIQSMKRVSAALRDYVEGDDPREFLLDSFITPPFTQMKKTNPGFIEISSKSYSPAPTQSQPKPTFRVNYLRSGGNPAVSVEERLQSPETAHIRSYSPVHHYGIDGFFAMQSSPMNSSSFFPYSHNDRSNIPPPSPQSSQWDFFWNPFSSLDYYGYPNQNSYDQTVMDDETRGLRQVREEEGIPDLEEDETEQEEECYVRGNVKGETAKTGLNCNREEVTVEDVDEEDEDDDEDDDEDEEEETECECEHEHEPEHEVKRLQSHGSASIGGVSQSQNARKVELRNQETAVREARNSSECKTRQLRSKDETPGFAVYVNRRPTSMAEVINDLETQFKVVCNSANEVSALLKASRAQFSSASNEITGMTLLNPVALFRSASSRSSSTRFLIKPSSSKDDEGYESGGDFTDKSCMFSGSHQSTLDRLYAWEKKLYDEVRAGEKVRIAYEKKCMQLRNQDVKGEESLVMDKTRASIRDLHTQIKVSIHSVEAISSRIETLRDEELHPQLLELVQGLSRMWKVMAECHQTQKRTLDEAKLLLAGTPSKLGSRKNSSVTFTDPQKLAGSASNLETELRNWRTCFESWITSQRSYVQALKGWLLRCVRSDSDTSKPPFSPRRSSGAPPIFGICIQWARSLGAVQEKAVLDGLDFFAAGMGSLYGQQLKEDYRPVPYGSKRYGSKAAGGERDMEMVEVGDVEDVMTTEKMAEVGIRVLCAGMSVAMSSLAEFANGSAEGYGELVDQWEKAKWQDGSSGGTGT